MAVLPAKRPAPALPLPLPSMRTRSRTRGGTTLPHGDSAPAPCPDAALCHAWDRLILTIGRTSGSMRMHAQGGQVPRTIPQRPAPPPWTPDANSSTGTCAATICCACNAALRPPLDATGFRDQGLQLQRRAVRYTEPVQVLMCTMRPLSMSLRLTRHLGPVRYHRKIRPVPSLR